MKKLSSGTTGKSAQSAFAVRLLLVLCLWGALPAAFSISVYHDISYLEQGRKEKLDIYLPSVNYKRPLPAVLLIHGGGWRIGDKADPREKNIAMALVRSGYAVFSINYMLNVPGGRNPETGRLGLVHLAWPQNFYDCKSALRFIRANAGRYGIDPDRIAVMGGSAGGHLAMMVGATADNDAVNRHGLYTEESNAVSCIVNFYGLHDVRNTKINPFFGLSEEIQRQRADEASPVLYFDAGLPPMFITHGTEDDTVSVEMSRSLTRELDKLKVPYRYIEIKGAGHSYDLQPAQMDLRFATIEFLEEYLGKPKQKN